MSYSTEQPSTKRLRKAGARYSFYNALPNTKAEELSNEEREMQAMQDNDPKEEFARFMSDLDNLIMQHAAMPWCFYWVAENRFTRQLFDLQQNQPPMYTAAPAIVAETFYRYNKKYKKPLLIFRVNADVRFISPLYTTGYHVYHLKELTKSRPTAELSDGRIVRMVEDETYTGAYDYQCKFAKISLGEKMAPPKGRSLREFLPAIYGVAEDVAFGPIIEIVSQFIFPQKNYHMLFDALMCGRDEPAVVDRDVFGI